MTNSIEGYIKTAKEYLDGAYQNRNNIKDDNTGVIIAQLINTCKNIIDALDNIRIKQEALERRQLTFESSVDRDFKALQRRIGSLERG